LYSKRSHFGENLGEPLGGAAGRIFLQAVMDLDDFEVERRSKNYQPPCA